MSKQEFCKWFAQHRQNTMQRQVKAGSLRVSEAVMMLADVRKDAERFWRKYRTTLVNTSIEAWSKAASQGVL